MRTSKGTNGIYCIVCVPNGRMYFGSSDNIEARWREHRQTLDARTHNNPIFQNCWNKYGSAAFTWQVVEVSSEADLLPLEQLYLNVNFENPSSCMNIARVAGSPMKGRKHTAEAKKKIGDATRGKKFSEARKKNMRKPKTAAHSAKVGAALRGKRHTPEHRAKNKAGQHTRTVRGTEISTGRVVVFASLMSVKEGGFDPTHVSRCASGDEQQHKGFTWEDVEPERKPKNGKTRNETPEETASRKERLRLARNERCREGHKTTGAEKNKRARAKYDPEKQRKRTAARAPAEEKARRRAYYVANRDYVLARQNRYGAAKRAERDALAQAMGEPENDLLH